MKGLFFNNKSIRGVFLGSSIARIQIEELTYKNKGHVNVLPTAKVLAYNGSALELCNAGSGTGTILYSLDGTSYSSSIPSLIVAGSYTVYYKFLESNFYTESPVYTLNCSINEKLVSATIELSEDTYTYDGTAKTPTVTVKDGATTIDPSEYTVTYSNNTNAGTATVTITDNVGGNYNVVGSTTFTINKANRTASFDGSNGHIYVEIGGLKWATMNVGANSVTDTGLYFQWGDTQGYTASEVGSGEGQKYFGWADYKYGNGTSSPDTTDITKYNSTDGKTVLDTEDDAVVAAWGGGWRIPTKDEYAALVNATTLDWTTDYEGSGVAGMVLTSKADSSKKLFFAACGCANNGGVHDLVYFGSCWSSSLYSGNVSNAYYLDFGYGSMLWDVNQRRYWGYTVRGILNSSYKTSLAVGETDTITVYTSGSPTITLSSSDTSVATVSGMTVTAVGAGTTTITATIAGDSNYNSASISYTLTVPYPNGIYAAYADGSLRTLANADSNALGVAVITDDCKFIIDKTNNTTVEWDTEFSTNGVISGCTAVNSGMENDFAGVSNTNAITSVTSGGEAAKYCRQCSLTIDGVTKQGYLGACGEWYAAYQNKTDIDAMMTAIGGTAFITNNPQYSSTLLSAAVYLVWGLSWLDGAISDHPKYAYCEVRPLYPLD